MLAIGTKAKGPLVTESGVLRLAVLSCLLPVLAGCGGALTLAGPKSSPSTNSTPAGPKTPGGSVPSSGSDGPGSRVGTFTPHVRGIDACPTCFVLASPSANTLVPSNALAATGLQNLSAWFAATDTAGASGTASGTTGLVGSPSLSGSAREFTTTFTNAGDERYAAPFGADTESTHFFYDGWLYLASPSDDIANLEMDLNQVLANGQTVIFGFQCDGYSGTWDYTKNAGTPEAPVDQWVHTTQPCNPRTWVTDTWHHVQISFTRDDAGNATYNAVWLDGNEQLINATVPAAFALGWSSTLLTNFQVDGLGSGGSSTVYLDQLTVSRW